MAKKIFVAGPYNSDTESVKENRVKSIAEYCVYLFDRGSYPISALLMGLSFANYGKLPTDTETWREFSVTMIKGVDELHVLMIEGWDTSTGVKYEIERAKEMGIEIKYINLNNIQ